MLGNPPTLRFVASPCSLSLWVSRSFKCHIHIPAATAVSCFCPHAFLAMMGCTLKPRARIPHPLLKFLLVKNLVKGLRKGMKVTKMELCAYRSHPPGVFRLIIWARTCVHLCVHTHIPETTCFYFVLSVLSYVGTSFAFRTPSVKYLTNFPSVCNCVLTVTRKS